MALIRLLPMIMIGALFAWLAASLIQSGRRSGGSERWLGSFFLLLGLSVPIRGGVAMGIDLGFAPGSVNLAGQTLLSGSLLSLAYFVLRVFRSDSDWGQRAFWTIGLLIALQLVLFATSGAASLQSHPVHMLVLLVIMLPMGWAFGESLRYWRMMRRRVQLGIGDDIIANRFGLWTIWTAVLMIIPIVNLSVRLFAFVNGMGSHTSAVGDQMAWALDLIRALMLICGPVVVISSWLIFFPPRRYLAYISRRASADGAARA